MTDFYEEDEPIEKIKAIWERAMTEREAAWITAGWCRIEGDLWCCPFCHAASPRPDDHTEWHESLKAKVRRAWMPPRYA